MTLKLTCPSCKMPIDVLGKNNEKALQHHLWGKHNVEVVRSHYLAKKLTEKIELSPEEWAEIGRAEAESPET